MLCYSSEQKGILVISSQRMPIAKRELYPSSQKPRKTCKHYVSKEKCILAVGSQGIPTALKGKVYPQKSYISVPVWGDCLPSKVLKSLFQERFPFCMSNILVPAWVVSPAGLSQFCSLLWRVVCSSRGGFPSLIITALLHDAQLPWSVKFLLHHGESFLIQSVTVLLCPAPLCSV